MAEREREEGDLSSQATVAAPETGPCLPPSDAAPRDDGAPLAPGSVFGDYEILGELGRGGMGVVYRCRHRTLDRLSALKILHDRAVVEGTAGEQRFLREARSAAQLDHHNVVTIFHAGQERGLLYIDMQLVDGRPLSAVLAGGALDPLLATRYVEQIAHALQHAHGRGIIHRDIKPDNVLVTTDDVVKVADFGLAKPVAIDTGLTAPGSLMGTPCYMAPEQWRGEPTDARTDLYALGVTYYHLATGQPPYGGNLVRLLRQHTEEPVPLAHEVRPAVPPAIGQVIERLMAKRPADRYQTANELILALRRIQHAPSVEPQAGSAAADPNVTLPPPSAPPTAALAPGAPSPAALPTQAIAVEAAPGRRWSRLLGLVLVAALAVAAALGAHAAGLGSNADLRAFDLRMVRRDAQPRFARATLVLIDEDTAQELGMPIPREALADVIDALEQAGARVVALDLLIPDADPGMADAALVAATGEARHLVHALDLQPAALPSVGARPTQPAARLGLDLPAAGLITAGRAVLPFPALLARARQLGNVAVIVDPDGVVRRIPLLVAFAGRVYPALSLVIACEALGARLADLRWSPGTPLRIPGVRGGSVEVPVEGPALLRLSVRGELSGRPRLSFREVLKLARAEDPAARQRLSAAVRGRVVLLGTSVSGQADVQPMPGIEVAPLITAHLMAAETILGGDFVSPPGGGGLLLVVLLLAGLGLAAGLLPLPYSALAVPVAAAGYWVVSAALFERSGLALPVVAPGLALLLAALGSGALRGVAERRQRRRVTDALGRYVPRKLAQQILAAPHALRLGGRRKELSLVVVTLHDFAAISEKLEPEEVGLLLDAFFAATGDAVARCEGTLDRFDGDGVRAFFGDPLPQPDHAARAVRCAIEIRHVAAEVVTRWATAGRPRLAVGVGVSTGYVTVGNIGTLQRMEYTVLGRAATRAEQLARAARDRVLVDGRTRAVVEGTLAFDARPGAGVADAHEPQAGG